MQITTVSDERGDITIDLTYIKSYFNIKWMLETNLWPKKPENQMGKFVERQTTKI